jgi:hypothetical protein
LSFLADLISAPYNAVTGNLTDWQKTSLSDAEQEQIHTVSENAAEYYGEDSSTALISERVADEQAAQAGSDTNTLAKLSASSPGGCPGGGLNLNGVGLGCISSVDDFLSKLQTLTHVGLLLVAVLAIGWVGITFGPTIAATSRRLVK